MKNIDKFRAVLESDGLDAILLTSRHHRHYCVSYDIAEGYILLTRADCYYMTDSRYVEAAQKNLSDAQPVLLDASHSLKQLLTDAVQRLQIRTLGYEERELTVSEFEQLQDMLGGVLFQPCQSKLEQFRAAKEPWELERMTQAQEITDLAFADLLPVIRAGMTEKQLAAELIYRLYRFGADALSFDPIVVSGPNTSLPHGVPGERVLQQGDFITLDFGCKYRGYCSDMTRTVALGFATDEMHCVYDTVLGAQAAGISATKAGKLGREIDYAARKVIADAGYGAYFGHGYGHSLGLQIHENPNCNPSGSTAFPAGAVCSAEPGIYIPGKFGVRIEDVVIFTDSGCQIITKSPKALLIL